MSESVRAPQSAWLAVIRYGGDPILQQSILGAMIIISASS